MIEVDYPAGPSVPGSTAGRSLSYLHNAPQQYVSLGVYYSGRAEVVLTHVPIETTRAGSNRQISGIVDTAQRARAVMKQASFSQVRSCLFVCMCVCVYVCVCWAMSSLSAPQGGDDPPMD